VIVAKLRTRLPLGYPCAIRQKSSGASKNPSMHRQTARLLLIWLLVSVLTPLALAISAPAPHACCVRKPLDDSGPHGAAFHAPPGCCNHDCCRPLTVRQWAHFGSSCRTHELSSAPMETEIRIAPTSNLTVGFQSSRAPPRFSIA